MSKLSKAQIKALRHVEPPEGAVLDNFNRVLSAGETRPSASNGAFLRLLAQGLITGRDGRIFITDSGRDVLARYP